MKKYYPYILICLIVVGLFAPVHFAHAQLLDSGFWGLFISAIKGGASAIVTAFISPIAYAIISFLAWVTGLASLFLNFVIDFTIVNFTKNISGFTGINTAWKVIKDIMNIFFIFILIYQAIMLIISQENTDKIGRFIVMVVLASILINFSLFFTKIMIDASNIVTTGLYNGIVGDTANGSKGLADPVLQKIGLQGIYKVYDPSFGADAGKILVSLIGTSILLIVTSVVLFAVSSVFVVRYVTLLFLLMLSPVAYMGMALPFMQGAAKDWWESLKGQLLFAPIYMLLMWVSLTLMASPGFIDSATNLTSWGQFLKDSAENTGPTVGSMGLVLNFVVVIGLMIASLTIARQTASKGSKLIGQAINKVSAFTGGAVLGGSAWVGRRTVGAAASRVSESQRFQNFAANNWFGEQALKGARGVASSSFDARASRVTQQVSKATGVDLGDAQKGGYNKILKNKTDAKEEFGKSLRGDVAKELYATRLASRTFTRGGSASGGYTLFGTLGRENRVVASRILNKQLEPLETAEQTLQNRESQLSQQVASLTNEQATLNALGALGRNAQQNARLAFLNGPATQRGSVAHAQDQLNTTQASLTNTTNEMNRIRGVVTTTGLVNPTGVRTQADVNTLDQLNRRLAMVNAAVARRGGTPTPAQQAVINRLNAQINAVPGDPSLGVLNTRNRTIRGRRADEQNY